MVKEIKQYMCERCHYIGFDPFDWDKCPACGNGETKIWTSTIPPMKFSTQEYCLIDEAHKRAIEQYGHSVPLGISCPCRKCSPRC